MKKHFNHGRRCLHSLLQSIESVDPNIARGSEWAAESCTWRLRLPLRTDDVTLPLRTDDVPIDGRPARTRLGVSTETPPRLHDNRRPARNRMVAGWRRGLRIHKQRKTLRGSTTTKTRLDKRAGCKRNWAQSSARMTKIRAQFSAQTTQNRAQFRARMTKSHARMTRIWSQSSTRTKRGLGTN